MFYWNNELFTRVINHSLVKNVRCLVIQLPGESHEEKIAWGRFPSTKSETNLSRKLSNMRWAYNEPKKVYEKGSHSRHRTVLFLFFFSFAVRWNTKISHMQWQSSPIFRTESWRDVAILLSCSYNFETAVFLTSRRRCVSRMSGCLCVCCWSAL